MKAWFKRHENLLYAALVCLLFAPLIWRSLPWPVRYSHLPEARLQLPEETGFHVTAVTRQEDLIRFAVSQTADGAEAWSWQQSIDYRGGDAWHEIAKWAYDRPAGIIPVPDGALPFSGGQPMTVETDLAALVSHAKSSLWRPGLYRVRYYDGVYEFQLKYF